MQLQGFDLSINQSVNTSSSVRISTGVVEEKVSALSIV